MLLSVFGFALSMKNETFLVIHIWNQYCFDLFYSWVPDEDQSMKLEMVAHRMKLWGQGYSAKLKLLTIDEESSHISHTLEPVLCAYIHPQILHIYILELTNVVLIGETGWDSPEDIKRVCWYDWLQGWGFS